MCEAAPYRRPRRPAPNRRPADCVWAKLLAATLPAAAVAVLLLPACASSQASGGGRVSNGASNPGPATFSGQTLYSDRCAVCHGAKGQGLVGAKLAGGAVTGRFPRPEDETAEVTKGSPTGTMPAFGGVLTPEEIRAVVDYTRSL